MKTILDGNFPDTMRALVLNQFDGKPETQEMPVQTPGKGEILVKMDSSPINPSDWSFIRGLYSSMKTLPVIPGFEGSGVVVATGNDYFSKRLLGKNVSCFAPQDGNGTWAEYMLTRFDLAVPLGKKIDLEHASMLLVNPLSVVAMTELTKKRGIKAIANTAGASALGQILNKMCLEKNIVLVNIVRRQEQVDLLKNQGAKYIVNSGSQNYKKELAEVFKKLNVMIAFDAISGHMPLDLLEALPRGGEVIVYGALSEEALSADPGRFIFEQKRISGFWLSEWVTHQNIFKLLSMFGKIQKFITEKHHTNISNRVSLERTGEVLATYNENMTAGKVLVKPWE